MGTTGAKIRERRTLLGISQAELAEKIGVTRLTVNRWENGRIRVIGHENLREIAEALKTTPDELLEIENDTNETEAESEMYHMTPQQEVLFDASGDLSTEEMDAVLCMIRALKSNRSGSI